MVKINLVGEEEDISWSDLYTHLGVSVYILVHAKIYVPSQLSQQHFSLDRLPHPGPPQSGS